MTTSLQRDRIRTRFDRWDMNGDGRLDRSDCDVQSQRILRAFGEAPTSRKGRALTDAYLSMWNFFADKAGIDAESGRLTLEQFDGIVTEHLLGNDGVAFGEVVKPAIRALVELADVDSDGRISTAEFKTWLDAVEVETIDPAVAFRQIHPQGDSELSVDELVRAVRAYHMGEIDVSPLGC